MTNPQTEARAIQRYIAPSAGRGAVVQLLKHCDGEWVRYEEHATALAAKDAELAEVHQQYVDANEARIDAEAQLAEARKALEPDAYEVRCTDGNYEWRRPYHGELEVIMRTGRDRSGKPFEYRALYAAISPLSALEPSAPEGQQEPAARAHELSGNTGELIDKMAEAIRGDTVSDDTPWATLSEDRKIGWRGDAERALAVVKHYLTASRPSEQAVTEAMVEAVVQAVRQYTRETLFIDEHRELVRAALKAAMEAGRHE